jgi:hypothetical protein
VFIRRAPYQVHIARGNLIYAPHDTDDYIRGLERSPSLSPLLLPAGPPPVPTVAGQSGRPLQRD